MALFARNAFRAFDDVFARELAPILRAPSSFFTVEGGSYPRLDVRETATAYQVDAEVPGFQRVARGSAPADIATDATSSS